MMLNVAMLILCLIVVAAMAGVIRWFLKRLKKIEVAMWGEKERQVIAMKHKNDES